MIASKDGTACILLYGAIGSWDDADVRSGDIVRELMEIEGSYNKIDVRINSMGGEVYAGIAIFNATGTPRPTLQFMWTVLRQVCRLRLLPVANLFI